MIDILFVVPDAHYETSRQAVKHVLQALGTKKTCEICSANDFLAMKAKDIVRNYEVVSILPMRANYYKCDALATECIRLRYIKEPAA